MKTLSRISRSVSVAPFIAMSYASYAVAQFAGPDPEIEGTPGAGEGEAEGIREVILNALEVVLSFLALIAVVVVVIAGIRLIISQGEEEQKEKAKKTIFYALIGLAIVLFARVIVGLITETLASTVGA